MRILLAALFLCLAALIVLIGGAESASARAELASENRVGVFGENPNITTKEFIPLALPLQSGSALPTYDVVPGVCVGPNLYTYVNQNPWTYYDPHGLYLMEKLPVWAQPLAAVMLPGLPIVDGFIDGGIEGRAAYNTSRQAGDGRGGAALIATGVALTRATGGLDMMEAAHGEGVVVNDSGTLESVELGGGERVVKGLTGSIKLAATAVPAAKGASKMVPAKGGSPAGPTAKTVSASGPKSGIANEVRLSSVFEGHKPGQGFSSVYDEATGQIAMRPSPARAADPVPDGWVPRRGGHARVSAELGGDRAGHHGFATVLESDGSVRITWRSGQLNRTSDAMVPQNMREQIVKSVEEQTGRSVSSQ